MMIKIVQMVTMRTITIVATEVSFKNILFDSLDAVGQITLLFDWISLSATPANDDSTENSVNDCEVANGGCDHLCIVTPNGHDCNCTAG